MATESRHRERGGNYQPWMILKTSDVYGAVDYKNRRSHLTLWEIPTSISRSTVFQRFAQRFLVVWLLKKLYTRASFQRTWLGITVFIQTETVIISRFSKITDSAFAIIEVYTELCNCGSDILSITIRTWERIRRSSNRNLQIDISNERICWKRNSVQGGLGSTNGQIWQRDLLQGPISGAGGSLTWSLARTKNYQDKKACRNSQLVITFFNVTVG